MIDPVQPAAKLKVVSESDATFIRQHQSLADKSPEDWGLGRAWRQRILWEPVARCAESVVASSLARHSGQFAFNVLLIGRDATVLSAMLARAAARQIQFEVRQFQTYDLTTLPFQNESFDCVIALDWLPLIRSSQREAFVNELCRIARLGVVVANPFHSPEIAAAERAVNDLHLAATGKDEPALGKHLEYGLPDLQCVTDWVGSVFTHVESRAIDDLGTWQTSAVVVPDSNRDVSSEDAAMAALLPSMRGQVQQPYRTMIVGSVSPLAKESETSSHAFDFGAMASHLAIEAASQRRVLDRLNESITREREREREEFRETVASLAVEINERETYAGLLAGDLKERERIIADQTAVIESLEHRLGESDSELETVRSQAEELTTRLQESERQLREREGQMQRMINTLGWRLLSRYGSLKFGVLFPFYRLLGRVSPETNEIKRMHNQSHNGSDQQSPNPNNQPEEGKPLS